MANFSRREKSSQWKGGRRLGTNGYWLIRVEEGHPLRMKNGYAYEHKLRAESILGRPLETGEVVHHKDGNKTNNADNNLEVKPSHAAHLVEHRKRKDLRLPGEPNLELLCGCGCGLFFQQYDGARRPRRFIHGHAARLKRRARR